MDDYIGADGLLYCGKCNTPKQTRITFLGETKTPACLCGCEIARQKREQEEKKRKEFTAMVGRFRDECFSDRSMVDWTFANDDLSNPEITKAMQRYVDGFDDFRKEGRGIMLHGEYGTGKTYAACEVANALIDKGYSCYVTNFSRILNAIQSIPYRQEYIDDLTSFQLLVIDDLGVERETEYAKEQIYNVIDAWYRSGKPLIVTTNLSMAQIKNPQNEDDKRIYDRIIERCFPIKVSGKSKRKEKAAMAYETTKQKLIQSFDEDEFIKAAMRKGIG